MFDLNRRYNWLIIAPIAAPIVALIHIKRVRSSSSYQLATYPEYNRRGRESPSGYGPLYVLYDNIHLLSFSLAVYSYIPLKIASKSPKTAKDGCFQYQQNGPPVLMITYLEFGWSY